MRPNVVPFACRRSAAALLVFFLVGAPASFSAPGPVALSLGLDAFFGFPPLFGLGVGPRLSVSWEPVSAIRLESGLSARRLVGWGVAADLSAAWLPLRRGAWSPSVGPTVELTYGSDLVVSTSQAAAVSARPLGAYPTVAPGISVAPLDFRLGGFDISVLRATFRWRFAPGLNAPAVGCTIFSLRVPVGRSGP